MTFTLKKIERMVNDHISHYGKTVIASIDDSYDPKKIIFQFDGYHNDATTAILEYFYGDRTTAKGVYSAKSGKTTVRIIISKCINDIWIID